MPAAAWSWTWACGCCVGGRKSGRGAGAGETGASGRVEEGDEWSLFMDLLVLDAATDGFSDHNLLGRGGFGPVYKAISSLPIISGCLKQRLRSVQGVLQDGQEIAVKKLSLGSRQGVREFLNEVRLLLKVQHRNLVSLLGCCASSGHKMLVYPYFPNGSLDHILFGGVRESSFTNMFCVPWILSDKEKSFQLDWPKRYQIIIGLARGLLYLHEESPVKIIHRDIKASNVLLDDQLNPKISDFGMARLFLEDATHVNTFRISGTYGYMAPEYAMNGYLSTKTDVFSFGILVLEIVSGRKNMTWKLFEEGRSLEIVDPSLSDPDTEQTLLCIQLGLLCCQAVVSDRPDMHSVHLILSSDSFTLPKPGKPAIHGRIGRWVTTATSGSASASATGASSSNTNTTSTFGTDTNMTKTSVLANIAEDESRNSISISFTTEGR
ncbi:putative receptor-like protein kinase [Dichanthelium oligosanthes]|uniref:Putative receptor-like protein kinase n=1 Tax=Dichanthelium oligosanthes TaxID=888268 RepID=A0A1E5VU22_9POAL|nr:putative receptor-like protein kinase [Dichanthelium oligosanthes]